MSRFSSRAVLCLLFASVSCGSESKAGDGGSSGAVTPTDGQPSPTVLFSPATKRVQIEIDYAPGAEPYVGAAGQFSDVWSVFKTNTTAIFEGRRTVSVPTKLAQMEKLDDVTATEFTYDEIVAVAKAHRNDLSEGDLVTYYVVFLAGTYKDDDGTVRKDILGMSLGTTGVIAMFKPAIAAAGSKFKAPAAQFTEQASLLHQFGHAIGLVNNGVPVAPNNPHHDEAHGSHCTNAACIMSWKNEGASALDFAMNYIQGQSPSLFDQSCLSDARVLEDKLRNP